MLSLASVIIRLIFQRFSASRDAGLCGHVQARVSRSVIELLIKQGAFRCRGLFHLCDRRRDHVFRF